MYIHEIHVSNFRSVLSESLFCDSLTALVGRNGSGKSTFLKALEIFYDPSARVTAEDFYAEDTTRNIEIAVTFDGLSQESKKLFAPYIENNTLSVVRVFAEPQGKKSGTYHGLRLQNPEFQQIRQAGGNRDITRKYNEVKKDPQYASLPTVRSAADAQTALLDWERENPERCKRIRDDGQFFGFTQVGQGYLGRFTKFIHVPAVRDAQDDATENRGSCVTEIMDLVVRSVLASRPDVTTFKERTQVEYRTIMNPANLSELSDLGQSLSATLKSYVPDANVVLRWTEFADIQIPMPEAEVRLQEDDYESSVERTGHGLQRALILTMLQHLVAARESDFQSPELESQSGSEHQTNNTQLPSLILAIEEPELYQHPSRQRHLASVLLQLATGAIPGVAANTQVIYTTHSPLFVGLHHFDQIRVLRKTSQSSGKPKATRLEAASLAAVADELWRATGAKGPPFKSDTLLPRLRAILTPWMSEGFFADTVVLVEGEDDRAALLGIAHSMGRDFDSHGIAVIPCFGKSNLDRPLVIFRQLGIPIYVVWDGDFGGADAKPDSNRYLLRLLGHPEEDWPNFVADSCACFKYNLETALEEEVGSEQFDQLLATAQAEFGIGKKTQALKNAAVIEHIIAGSHHSERSGGFVTEIVKKIFALNVQAAGKA